MKHVSIALALLALLTLPTLATQTLDSPATPSTEEPTSQLETMYVQIRGMQSPDCELLAEGRVLDALGEAAPELMAAVRADHSTGWIRIELDRPSVSEDEAINPKIRTALETAFEGACSFEFVRLQRREPSTQSSDDGFA